MLLLQQLLEFAGFLSCGVSVWWLISSAVHALYVSLHSWCDVVCVDAAVLQNCVSARRTSQNNKV